MTELARLKFYATQAHACSYLPDEQATTLFLDPSQDRKSTRLNSSH